MYFRLLFSVMVNFLRLVHTQSIIHYFSLEVHVLSCTKVLYLTPKILYYFRYFIVKLRQIHKKNPAAAILLQNSLQQDYRIDQIFCVWHGRIPQHIPYRSALRNPALLQDQNAVTHIADHGDVV